MAQEPKKQNTSAPSARKAAVLQLVKMHGGMYANLAAKGVPAALSREDKAFAGALFYGTAERVATLDALINTLSNRPVPRLDKEVRAVLETGLYQLLFMAVPPSAAVNESVKLTRAMGKSSAAGMVNAILRKAATLAAGVKPPEGQPLDIEAVLGAFGVTPKTETGRVALVYATSEAVAGAVMQALPDEYDDFLAATLGVGKWLSLRTNTLQTTPEALREALLAEGAVADAAPLPGALYARLPGAVAADPLFAGGQYHVQGLASQYAAACVGARPGMKVLDLCAAPGGKSATLAQYMGGGAGLTACDIHPHRVQLIRETLARLGITGATVQQNDAAVYNEALQGQDRILCDVPCSGLGVLAKKPDLRLNSGEGFAALPGIQLAILQNAARCLAPGGRIVYSTCTIRREENDEVVERFLHFSNDFHIVPPPVAPPNGAVSRKTGVTLLPHRTGFDGFFVACIERMC